MTPQSDLNREPAIAHKWEPIAPLAGNGGYDFSGVDSLRMHWLAAKSERGAAYNAFLERLTRSWAIETGIIEGLYTLDRGMTATLVTRGISVDLIDRASTNKEPQELVRMLNDHQDAVNGVYAEIQERKPITRSAIRQIHATLTQSQPTFQAMNQFGQMFEAQLEHGDFKKWPNNPTRPDGAIHEYCPPIHVESELDNLLLLYDQYIQDTGRYHPLMTAAWLHHRFTQIHPFQDGNGRVVRALLTWHLVREDYLPVVVERNDREQYIAALEHADGGNLIPFVDLIVHLQKRTIKDALREPVFTETTGAFEQVLGHIVEQVGRQSDDRETQMRSVNIIAETLRDRSVELLAQLAEQVSSSLRQAGSVVSPHVLKGGPQEREYWYRHQVAETANNAGHRVNFSESRFFVRLTLNPSSAARLPRLIFVVSLHHTGWQLSGIMAATAFALIEHYYDDVSEQAEERVPPHFIDCTLDPFLFDSANDADALLPGFQEWIELRLSIALRQWGQYLS